MEGLGGELVCDKGGISIAEPTVLKFILLLKLAGAIEYKGIFAAEPTKSL